MFRSSHEIIDNQFSLYLRMKDVLFTCNANSYSSHDFYSILESSSSTVNNVHSVPPVTRNTFYTNRKKLEENYTQAMNCFGATVKLQPYYHRLKMYLLDYFVIPSLNPYENGHILAHVKVPAAFYPLYIGLVCASSKSNNWSNMSETALDIAHNILQYDSDFFLGQLSLSELDTLYEYWLQLFLPAKLYDLIIKIENFTNKQIHNRSVYRALRINADVLINQICTVHFKTLYMQDKFYDTTACLLDEYLSSNFVSHPYEPMKLALPESSDKSTKEMEKYANYRNLLLKKIHSNALCLPTESLPLEYVKEENELFEKNLTKQQQENRKE